jgi:hypothetical protein
MAIWFQANEPIEDGMGKIYKKMNNISDSESRKKLQLTLDSILEKVDSVKGNFDLDEILEYNGIIIAPPVVELSDGVPAIVDGIHRFYLAKQLGVPVKAIYIEGATLPLISYPVSWDVVKEYDEAPENPKHRRALRLGIEDKSEVLRTYYRDFSLLGSRGRRPRQGQNG